MWEFLHCRT